MRFFSETRPFKMRFLSGELRFNRYMSCSQVRSNGHQRILTGYIQDAERKRTGRTAYKRTSNVHPPDIFIRWRPLEVLNMFKTCQRMTKRTSPDTERIHRTRNRQEMQANGHERTDNFTVRYASVSAIR